jgi:hypothetical protein
MSETRLLFNRACHLSLVIRHFSLVQLRQARHTCSPKMRGLNPKARSPTSPGAELVTMKAPVIEVILIVVVAFFVAA